MSRVQLLDVPVALCTAAEQHTNDLVREVALVVTSQSASEADGLLGRLLATADALGLRSTRLRQDLDAAVAIAHDHGLDRVTVEIDVDDRSAALHSIWVGLLDEVDEMCRRGALLTLPSVPEIVAFRRWYAREVEDQVHHGRAARPWTARPLAVVR